MTQTIIDKKITPHDIHDTDENYSFENCELENIELSSLSLNRFDFYNCSGNFTLIFNAFSDYLLIDTIKEKNTQLNVELKHIYLNETFSNKQLEGIILKHGQKKEIIEFSQCIFDNELLIVDSYQILFNECSGKLFIQESNLSHIKISRCNFDKLDMRKSKAQKVSIFNQSKGHYSLPESHIERLEIEYHYSGLSLKSFYFIPLFLWVSFGCIFVDMKILFPTFITTMAIYFGFICITGLIMDNAWVKKEKMKVVIRYGLSLPLCIILIAICYFVYSLYDITLPKGYEYILPFVIGAVVSLGLLARRFLMSHYFTLLKLSLERSTVHEFILPAKKPNFFSYYLTSRNGTAVEIEKSIIKNITLQNHDGLTVEERIYFLTENNRFFIDSFYGFEQLKQDKNLPTFEFLLKIKNIAHTTSLENNQNINHILSNLYFVTLNLFYENLYRVKNILISLFLMVLLGVLVFNQGFMTISDLSTQIHLAEHNDSNKTNNQVFYNILSDKNTKIYAPDFYPIFSATNYTFEQLIPLFPSDKDKHFRPNNQYSEIMAKLFKIFGSFYCFALVFILTKRFFIKEKD